MVKVNDRSPMGQIKNHWLTTVVPDPGNIFPGTFLLGILDCIVFYILLMYKQTLRILDVLLIIWVPQNVSV